MRETFPIRGDATQTNTDTKHANVDLYQINIQGMITLKNNKSRFLKETIEHGNSQKKIVAITETWANNNFDAEYKSAFQEYNIKRSDRKVKQADGSDKDDDCLVNRGGVMILTSPDIPITPVSEFSNGNSEVLLVNLQTLSTIVAVMYRPSGKNFSLKKFNEAIRFLDTELTKLTNQHRDSDILLMGDFNFPKPMVEWISSQLGTLANVIDENTPQHQAFLNLSTLTEKYNLKQIVDKATRIDKKFGTENVLDLIFTNSPNKLGECSFVDLGTESDHKMIKTELIIQNS